MSITDKAPEPSMEEILSSIRRIISDDGEAPSSEEKVSAAEEVSTSEPETPVEPVAEVEEVGKSEPEPEPEMDMAMEMEAVEDVAEDAEPATPESVHENEDDDIFELTNIVETVDSEVEAVDSETDFEIADCGADVEDDIEFVSVETEEPLVDAEAEEPEVMALPELGPEPDLVADTVADTVVEPEGGDRLVSDNVGVATAASFGDLANTLLSRGDSASTVEELVQEMLRPLLKGWLDANLPTLVEKLVSEEIERIARRGR